MRGGTSEGAKMKITCLHTAQVHVDRFAGLFAAQGWDGALDHIVRPDLLARAQADGLDAVTGDLEVELTGAVDADVVLCTCSTLGPLIDRFDRADVLRIERPAMSAAAAYPSVLIALCLESTRSPSLALFEACAKDTGAQARVVICSDAWPHFEAGDMNAFYRSIAQSVGTVVLAAPQTGCIVLAQASMQGAAMLLSDMGVPVLTTPVLAVQHAIKTARQANR